MGFLIFSAQLPIENVAQLTLIDVNSLRTSTYGGGSEGTFGKRPSQTLYEPDLSPRLVYMLWASSALKTRNVPTAALGPISPNK